MARTVLIEQQPYNQSLSEDVMLNRLICLPATALALAVAPVALRAQVGIRPAAIEARTDFRPAVDQVTLGGAFGGLSGAANLDPSGTADCRLGRAASADAP